MPIKTYIENSVSVAFDLDRTKDISINLEASTLIHLDTVMQLFSTAGEDVKFSRIGDKINI